MIFVKFNQFLVMSLARTLHRITHFILLHTTKLAGGTRVKKGGLYNLLDLSAVVVIILITAVYFIPLWVSYGFARLYMLIFKRRLR